MKDGEKIIAKVEEVSDSEIIYRACDNLEGPRYRVKLSSIERVRFANGLVEEINDNESQVENNKLWSERAKDDQDAREGKKQIEPYGLASIIFLGASFLLAPILNSAGLLILAALVLAIISLVKFGREPGKYRGKGLPLAVIIFCGLALVTTLVYLGFLIALL